MSEQTKTERDMSEATYSGIRRAALLIAYDNGAINRLEPETNFLKRLDRVLARSTYRLAEINRWLLSLSDEQLQTVCCGGEEESIALCVDGPDGVTEFLDDIFEKAL